MTKIFEGKKSAICHGSDRFLLKILKQKHTVDELIILGYKSHNK